MTTITKANENDYKLLAAIGTASFIESHWSSAPSENLNRYINEKYDDNVIKDELLDQKNIYHIIYRDMQPAGYSKIMLNERNSNIPIQNASKMDRLYLLEKFYNLKLGIDLFKFNMELSKRNNQGGMWLFVWKENHRAIGFYKKIGFTIVGSYDFKIDETHSNPNHQMFLKY